MEHKILLAIIIGVILLSISVVGQTQFHDAKNQANEKEKKELVQLFKHEFEQKELRMIMGLEFIDTFYQAQKSASEFNDIVSELLSNIPDFKNIIILEDSNIVQSFPHTEFVGMNLEDVFPDHPRIENGKTI